MDAWHRLGRIFRLSNLGTLIFFLLNITLLCSAFFLDGITPENVIPLLICYIFTVLISFSQVGEWMRAALVGAKEIRRADIKMRLIPLLEIVFEQAKQKTPDMVGSIHCNNSRFCAKCFCNWQENHLCYGRNIKSIRW